jgi:hypothetical protein
MSLSFYNPSNEMQSDNDEKKEAMVKQAPDGDGSTYKSDFFHRGVLETKRVILTQTAVI